MKYDHTKDDLFEATGIDVKKISKKMKAFQKVEFDKGSMEVEYLATHFTRAELALSFMMLTHEADKMKRQNEIPDLVKEAFSHAIESGDLPFDMGDVKGMGVIKIELKKKKKGSYQSEGGHA